MAVIDLKLGTVIVTALIDSINPCAIGVLILLITCLLALKNRQHMLKTGIIYISMVYVAYFMAGIGLLFFIQKLSLAFPLEILVGIVVIIAGLIEVKDFFWYGRWYSLSIPPKYLGIVKKWAKKGTIPAAIVLGFIVAAVELPCTGGPYLAITTILARDFNMTAVYYLLLYNFIFVLPLIVILLLAYLGTSVKKLQVWKQKHRKWMRLAIGLVLLGLGVLLILFSLGKISI